MNLIKRNCPICFSIDTITEGWQDYKFTIDDKIFEFSSCASTGELVGKIVDVLNEIYSEQMSVYHEFGVYDSKSCAYECNEKNQITKYVGNITLDCERGTVQITITRNILPKSDLLNITFNVNFDEEAISLNVDIYDLFYAVTKGITEYIKKNGIMGLYYMSSTADKLDITHFLQLKSIALTRDLIPLYKNEEDKFISKIEEEIELLMFEM